MTTPDGCPHDGTTRHVTDVPQSGDLGDLLMGKAVTLCCGSFVSCDERGATYCKCCYGDPPSRPRRARRAVKESK